MFSISTSLLTSLLICELFPSCLPLQAETVNATSFYRAFLWTPAHGLDQLVDLLVVFQGVSQGVLGAEQPLAQTVHLRVQS